MGCSHFLHKKEVPQLHGAAVSISVNVKAMRVIW
jgi:hypothetical protein